MKLMCCDEVVEDGPVTFYCDYLEETLFKHISSSSHVAGATFLWMKVSHHTAAVSDKKVDAYIIMPPFKTTKLGLESLIK